MSIKENRANESVSWYSIGSIYRNIECKVVKFRIAIAHGWYKVRAGWFMKI